MAGKAALLFRATKHLQDLPREVFLDFP